MYGAGTGNLTVLTRTVTGANQTIQVISGDQKLNVWRKASVSTPPSPPLPPPPPLPLIYLTPLPLTYLTDCAMIALN